MKRIILLFAFAGMIFGANAQELSTYSGKQVKNIKLVQSSTKSGCDTLCHVCGPTDTLTLYGAAAGGYFFGVNGYNTGGNGEYFTYSGSGNLSEMYIYFGAVHDGGNGTNITITVYSPLNDTTPGTQLAQTQIPLSQITDTALTNVTLSNAANISGNFIITIDNPTGNNDTIGIVSNTENGSTVAPDEALMQFNGQWHSVEQLAGFKASLAIMPIVCTPTSTEDAELSNVVVYPTLTKGNILFGGVKNATVEVFDVTGNKVANFNNVSNRINIANLNNGIYFIRVTENGKVLNKKVILQK